MKVTGYDQAVDREDERLVADMLGLPHSMRGPSDGRATYRNLAQIAVILLFVLFVLL